MEGARSLPNAPAPWGRADASSALLERLSPALVSVLVLVLAGSAFADGLYAYSRWAPFALVVFALTIGFVLVRPPRFSRPAGVALGSLVGLLALSGLSLRWAPGTDRAWTEVDRLALYASLLLLGLTLLRSPKAGRALLGVFTLCVTVLSLYVLTRMLLGAGAELFLGTRLHEPIGYANAQAGLLLMGVMAAIAMAETGRPMMRTSVVAAAVLMANLMVLTQSRAVIPAALMGVAVVMIVPGRLARGWTLVTVAAGVAIALPVTLDVYKPPEKGGSALPPEAILRTAGLAILTASLVAFVLYRATSRLVSRQKPVRLRAPAGIALAAIPLVCVALLVIETGNPVRSVKEQWSSFRALEVRPSASRFTDAGGFRYDLWRIAWDQFTDNPLRGVGAGNYASSYFLERRTPEYVRQPHSIELQALSELGAGGGLFLLLAVGAVAVSAVRPVRGSPASMDPVIRVGALGVVVVWFAQTSVDWLYNVPGLTGVAILCAAALLVSPPATAARASRGHAPRGAVAKIVLVLIVGVLAAFVGRHYGATLYSERAEDHLPRQPVMALSDAQKALRLNPYSVNAYIAAAAAHARLDQYQQARAALTAASRVEPFNYVPWALMGDLATRRGDTALAREDYAQAKRLNPFDPLIAPAEDTR